MTGFFGLGRVLRVLRESAALTPEEVCQRTGLDARRLVRWERETTPNLNLDALGRLLDAYGADLCILGHMLREELASSPPPPPEEDPASPGSRRLRDERIEEAMRTLVADALRGMRAGKT